MSNVASILLATQLDIPGMYDAFVSYVLGGNPPKFSASTKSELMGLSGRAKSARIMAAAVATAKSRGRMSTMESWMNSTDIGRAYASAMNSAMFTASKPAASAVFCPAKDSTHKTPIKEESTMPATMKNFIDQNKTAAVTAAELKLGQLGLETATDMVAPHLPLMIRAYGKTPAAKFVIANLFGGIVEHFRPNDTKLKKAAASMRTVAFMELYNTLPIDKMVKDFTNKLNRSGTLDAFDRTGATATEAE